MHERIRQRIQSDSRVRELLDYKSEASILVTGVTEEFKGPLFHEVVESHDKPVVLFVENNHKMEKLQNQLGAYTDDIYTFPVGDIMIETMADQSPEFKKERMRTLYALLENEKGLFIVPTEGLMKPLMRPEKLLEYKKHIALGDDLAYDSFIRYLTEIGYVRREEVQNFGEFAVRGDIFDIYMSSGLVRIELFDTEVDSIRAIDEETKRSTHNLESVTLEPFSEYVLEEDERVELVEYITKLYDKTKSIIDKTAHETLDAYFEKLTDENYTMTHLSQFSHLLHEEEISILDYIKDDYTVLVDEVKNIEASFEREVQAMHNYYESLQEAGKMLAEGGNYLEHQLERLYKKNVAYFSLFLSNMPVSIQDIIKISVKPTEVYYGQYDILASNITQMIRDGFLINIELRDDDELKKTRQLLEDLEIDSYIKELPETVEQGVVLTIGNFEAGFILPFMHSAVLTSKELYNRTSKKKKRTRKLSNAEKIKSYQELNVGDYIVHVHHGVGRYLGIETLEVGGLHNDYMKLQYKGTDQLFVPVDQMDLVQKYVSSDDGSPKMHKLGGTEWKKTKAKVESSVNELADELLKLYQERAATKGFKFSSDNDMVQFFEERFPYKETPDQLASIHEIKQDMEKVQPMDRLLCGDVGYGKTEVAIRAAFKAVQDGKQVAVLVPTTILAAQHFETFIERIEDFPVNVEMMSRFRTPKEMREVKKGLKEGTVDIVVGTHTILGKTVEFKDLGLLIVDEEQRFGVKHKERIKQLKTNVDVLTLTATPIPRTLHMSLMGVRDLSVIETPPQNRFPVQTYVLEYDGNFVKEAINRELARGGQVFYLHNRTDTIYEKAAHVEMLAEGASVGVMHARMTELEIEETMQAFVNGEYDIIVTTTIIETGVDVPNANTLIIEDADRFGLSQLYQLRGRVGRSNRISYAYLFYQPNKVLTEVAEKRLAAIKEYTELGSGFKIAMRDLNIRGAGNLLGKHQSGFIDSVGYELYSDMLESAVLEKRGLSTEEEEPANIPVDIELDAYLPATYIQHEQSKIDLYKRLRSVNSIEGLRDIEDEMIDRFGDYPVEVEHLIDLVKVKIYALILGAYKVYEDKRYFYLNLTKDATAKINGEKLFMDTEDYKRILRIRVENNEIQFQVKTKDIKVFIDILKRSTESKEEETV